MFHRRVWGWFKKEHLTLREKEKKHISQNVELMLRYKVATHEWSWSVQSTCLTQYLFKNKTKSKCRTIPLYKTSSANSIRASLYPFCNTQNKPHDSITARTSAGSHHHTGEFRLNMEHIVRAGFVYGRWTWTDLFWILSERSHKHTLQTHARCRRYIFYIV